MSKLDTIKPSGNDGTYDVEIHVEGEWVVKALLSKESILKLAAYVDRLQEGEI